MILYFFLKLRTIESILSTVVNASKESIMLHHRFLFLIIMSVLFMNQSFCMEQDGNKGFVFSDQKPNFFIMPEQDKGKEKEDEFQKTFGNLVPLFKFAIQLAKIELEKERVQSSIPNNENYGNNQEHLSLFKPMFEGEDIRSYTKLDSNLIVSLLHNCPSLLRFQIGLMKNPTTYRSLNRVKSFAINKILLYGPPGSGKSSLAKAIADYCNFPRQFIIASSLLNQYKNSGQVNFRYIFEPLLKSDEYLAIIFDELTGLTNKHGKKNNPDEGTIEQFLGILDHCETHKNLLFIATTNEIKKLPPQIKDRFCGSMFKIAMPDSKRREKFIDSLFEDNDSDEENDESNEFKLAKAMPSLPPLKFVQAFNRNDKNWLTKQTSSFSMRQLNAMKCLAYLFALERNVDDEFTLNNCEIEVAIDDYKNSIAYIRTIAKENSKTVWKRYYKIFKEIYPFITQFLHLVGSLGLQYHGSRMQIDFANTWQERQALAQKEFQEASHQETIALQRIHNKESLVLAERSSKEQLEVQKNSAWWSWVFGWAGLGVQAVGVAGGLYNQLPKPQ